MSYVLPRFFRYTVYLLTQMSHSPQLVIYFCIFCCFLYVETLLSVSRIPFLMFHLATFLLGPALFAVASRVTVAAHLVTNVPLNLVFRVLTTITSLVMFISAISSQQQMLRSLALHTCWTLPTTSTWSIQHQPPNLTVVSSSISQCQSRTARSQCAMVHTIPSTFIWSLRRSNGWGLSIMKGLRFLWTVVPASAEQALSPLHMSLQRILLCRLMRLTSLCLQKDLSTRTLVWHQLCISCFLDMVDFVVNSLVELL